MQYYLVGGCVRDELLGLPIKDRDWVVVGATEQQMLALNFQKVGKDFPVFLHPKTREEYALARLETKTSTGYYGFTCYSSPDVTLEQDLQRRDLTINAMAKTDDGQIIDPFNGRQDLANKILRHVSPAFIEDPVRVLRVARFAARYHYLGFTVAAETIELMQQMVQADELKALIAERVWREIDWALAEKNPEQFFLVLRACKALAEIFPELDKLWGIPQTPTWHPEIDTGKHMELALQQAVKLSTDPKVRFAVLCHDLGKGVTPKDILPSHRGHESRGVPLVRNWCNKYKVPKSYKYLALRVTEWHLHSHRAFELKPATILKLFNAIDAFRNPVNLTNFLIACKADAQGREGQQDAPYQQADLLAKAFLAANQISVKDLNLAEDASGTQIGQALYKARVQAIKACIMQLK